MAPLPAFHGALVRCMLTSLIVVQLLAVRRPGWMNFVVEAHDVLKRYLLGQVGEEVAVKILSRMGVALRS